jgi:GMP reductase
MVDLQIIDLQKEKKVRIEYRSSLDKTVKDILGGIRSSCTYVGAPTLKQLSKCTTFVRVNNQYNDIFGRV